MSTTPLVTRAAFGETRLTNVEIGGQRRTAGFIQFLAEDQQQQNTKLRKRTQQELADQTLRQADKEKQQIWHGLTPETAVKASKNVEYLAAITPDLGLEETPESVWEGYAANPEQAAIDVRQRKQQIDDFIRSTPQHTGVVLSRDDQNKFTQFVFAQMRTQNAAFSDSMLRTCWNWLWEGECFNDFGLDESLITVTEPEPETSSLTVDAVLATTDTTTREGNALLKKVVDQQWMTELSPLIFQWYDHLAQDYSISVSKEDAQYLFNPVSGWFVTRGLAINADNLNAARRHQSARGVWDAWTAQEILDKQLQRGEIDRATYMFKANQAHRAGLLNRPVSEAKAKGLI